MSQRTHSRPERPIFEPLVDKVTDELLDNASEVSVSRVAEIVVRRFTALPTQVRLIALGEALLGATGARIERSINNGRDLCNIATPTEGRFARWSPENERLAAERRAARKPDRPLDS